MAETDLIGRSYGVAPTWDDLRIPVSSTQAGGSNPPSFAKFKDNGEFGLGYAVSFDGVNDSALIPHNDSAATPVFNFASSWSISFWAYLPANLPSTRYLFDHPQWYIRTNTNGRLQFNLNTKGSVNTSNFGYLADSRNHIVMVVEETTDTFIRIYINGELAVEDFFNGTLQADGGASVYVGRNTAGAANSFLNFVLDNLRFYNIALTESNIEDLYAGGFGTGDVVADANTVSYYKVNEGAGSSALDEKYPGPTTHTMTLTGAVYVTGLVQSYGTHGVFAFHFDPNEEQELFFTAQLPHIWIEYASIHPHVHWASEDNGVGNVSWGLEYTWSNVGEVFGNSQVVYSTKPNAGAYKHSVAGFAPLEGNDKRISSMLLCRVFRAGTNIYDTYAGQAVLLEIDFHYERFSDASQREYSKE